MIHHERVWGVALGEFEQDSMGALGGNTLVGNPFPSPVM
jgi:hypothetical protein